MESFEESSSASNWGFTPRLRERLGTISNPLEEDLPSRDPQILIDKHKLRGALKGQINDDEAAQLRQEVDRIRKKMEREGSEGIRDYYTAENLGRQPAKRCEELFGNKNDDTVLSKFWLGYTLFSLGEYNEAEEPLREAARGYEELRGNIDVMTLSSNYWLGITLFQLGRYDEAKEWLQETARGYEEVLINKSVNTVQSKYQLGRTLFEVKMYSQAEEMFRDVAEAQKTTLGEGHQSTIDSLQWLRRAVAQQEDANDRILFPGQSARMLQDTQHTNDVQSSQIEDTVQKVSQEPVLQPNVSHARQLHFADPVRKIIPEPVLPVPTSSSFVSGEIPEEFFRNRDSSSEPFTDHEMSKICVTLEKIHPKWSKSPKTYTILRIIGRLSSFNDLLDQGFSDYWLPVTERNLPETLSQNIRAAFVRAQYLVMSDPAFLEKRRHCHFKAFPFKSTGALGRGSYGWVDKVTCVSSDREYARKCVPRSAIPRRPKVDPIHQFVTEIKILKRLRHRHIITIIGSYTDTEYIGLLMLPIAEMDLSKYLLYATETHHKELRSFFGCLASALAFQHEHKIRHKDIKPKNILVYRGTVLFTDFGLSLDFKDASGSTTTDTANGFTPRYCAPEVMQYEPRNTKSDVWSLGIVFLEMLVVLKGMGVSAMEDFFETHGTCEIFVRANLGALAEFAEKLETKGGLNDNVVLSWVLKMLVLKPQARPTAEALVTWIQTHGEHGDGGHTIVFCGPCCNALEEDFSDLEMDVRRLTCDD